MMLQRTIALVARPGGNVLKYFAYFEPISLEIWTAFIMTALGLAVFIFLLLLFSYRDDKQMTKWNLLIHLLDILAFSIRTMFNKDNFLLQEKRYKYGWRTIMLTYILTGYFAYESYNAELTTALTRRVMKLPINTLEEILDTDMQMQVPAGTLYQTIFEFAPEGSEYKQMWDEKVVGKEFGSVSQNQEIMVAALKENYVVLTFGEAAYQAKNDNPCLLELLPKDPMMETQIGMYLQKDSPFTALFKAQLGILQETGVVSIVAKDDSAANLKECQGESTVLGLAPTIFLFVCIGFGVLTSIIILAIEMFVFHTNLLPVSPATSFIK